MRKTFLSILFVFLFSFIFVSAYSTNYTQLGSEDGSYLYENVGLFNTDDLSIADYVQGAGNAHFTPLVSDMDNDGIKEILIIDGSTIKIYQQETLNPIASFSIGISEITPPIIIDIDDDGYQEIYLTQYVKGVSPSVLVYQYNNSAISLISNHTAGVSDDGTYTEHAVMGCDDTENICVVITLNYDNGIPETRFDGYVFNSSNNASTDDFEQLAGASGNHCFAAMNIIPVGDFDNDQGEETVFTFYSNAVASDSSSIYLMDISSSLSLTLTKTDTNAYSNYISSGGSDCNVNPMTKYISPPLAADLDGFPYTKEIAYASQKDLDEFEMRSYSSSLADEERHPSLADADGTLVSNVALADAFSDTGTNDFCVMGFDNSSALPRIDILCGRRGTGILTRNNNQFKINVSTNLTSSDTLHFHNLIHSVDMLQEERGSFNADEIISSYGTVQLLTPISILSTPICYSTGDCDAEILWNNPHQPASVVPIDYQEVDRPDLLAMTSTNLWYIDDGVGQRDCSEQDCIPLVSFNPCNDRVMQLGTQIEIRVETEEINGDYVSVRAIIYDGQAIQQDSNWTAFSPSGTTFSLSGFNASSIVSNGLITVQGRDINDENKTTNKSYSFSVGNTGISYGDAICDYDSRDVTTSEDSIIPATDQNNNSITNGLYILSSYTNLGSNILWLIIMLVAGFAIMVAVPNSMPNMTSGEYMILVGITGFLEFVLLVIGALMGFIGAGIVISLIVIALGIVAVMVWRAISGAGTR